MLQTSLRARIFVLSLLVCFTALLPDPLSAEPERILVFAASSLKSALDPLARDFQTKTGKTVVVSYAASPALAKQILAGAPADVFISADTDWMDYLEKNASLKSGSRKNITGNTLVLIAPKDSKIELTLAQNFPLSAALGNGRLAVRSSYSMGYDFMSGEYHNINSSAPPFGNRSLIQDPTGLFDDPYRRGRSGWLHSF